MKLDPIVEEKIAETAFCWLDYDHYGSEGKAIKAFRRRKGMKEFPPEIVKLWLDQAVKVRRRVDKIKKEIAKDYGRPSHEYLKENEFSEGTDRLRGQLTREFPDINITVEHMIAMAWTMYYLR